MLAARLRFGMQQLQALWPCTRSCVGSVALACLAPACHLLLQPPPLFPAFQFHRPTGRVQEREPAARLPVHAAPAHRAGAASAGSARPPGGRQVCGVCAAQSGARGHGCTRCCCGRLQELLPCIGLGAVQPASYNPAVTAAPSTPAIPSLQRARQLVECGGLRPRRRLCLQPGQEQPARRLQRASGAACHAVQPAGAGGACSRD